MIAVDTNVVLRFLLGDDARQADMARGILEDGAFVPHGVLMEAEWVMRSAYRLDRPRIADLLADLIEIETVELADRDDLRWAVGRYRLGADWGDLLHLVACRDRDSFVTFDRSLAREAGADAPVTIASLN